MTKSKVKIKVIKKNSVKIYKMPVVTEKNLQRKAAGEMISVVSNWVSEFQQRRREESTRAFDLLLASYPQTDGV